MMRIGGPGLSARKAFSKPFLQPTRLGPGPRGRCGTGRKSHPPALAPPPRPPGETTRRTPPGARKGIVPDL
ncbi:unnamed protein product [Pipistrellus nathusii]|uniref:Uncharacterized protein n=1 Tax=Pipistrellus nathusii TaxID=59473 RepID=A0ABP0AAG2_PIPNA